MPAAADSWLEEHGDALYRYALLRLRDPQRAEEAVQETLLAALTAQARFAGEASVRTWLIGILKHKILDEFRRQAREAPLTDEMDVDALVAVSFAADGHWSKNLRDWGDPERCLAQAEFRAALAACLDGLPPRQARLFLLREILEQETAEVCKEMAISATNLWTTLHRARMALRQCLDQHWSQEAC